ncbi:MAG: glycosyltransferase family 2 protein [Burkholderiales bacterium]|nr:glycosyltransferase family 2 protein [Burkholderiales bacterium]
MSIVSHGHMFFVRRLLEDIARFKRDDIEVILTLNLPEELTFSLESMPFPIRIVKNTHPKGFAANHNHAFRLSHGENFVILNPDIRLIDNPFDALLAMVQENPKCIAAPLIVNGMGAVEDSARKFPTPYLLMKKLAGKVFHFSVTQDALPIKDELLMPDWVAGMFIVVPRALYETLQGLNEYYFLYYEDVEFCARARLAGCQILVNQKIKVIHEAQRDSHRKARYLMWHMKSAAKFFTSQAYLRISIRRLFGAM